MWRGADENNRINAKAVWPLVTRSKDEGGLGVLDLKSQNEALLLKNLVWEKYYKNGRLPNHIKRGSFWWRDILKLLDKFKDIASVSVADGSTCLLWEDC